MTLIDIVVAVRNEELTIIPFIESIRNINLPDSSVRMIFIEDGSTDNTLNLLNSLKCHSKDINAISLINP
ncbi:MAG TPA: glycosyltransferase, partial [Actinobacteria bacterium]|nr:glycosyltransferase [Actinomycetota bacterium]